MTTHLMRTPIAGPTSWREFRRALELATQGIHISDTDLSDDMEEALYRVREAAPNPPL